MASSVIREMQRQDHNEVSFHMYQIEERKKNIWTLACVKEDVEQWELSSSSGGGVKCALLLGKQFGIA